MEFTSAARPKVTLGEKAKLKSEVIQKTKLKKKMANISIVRQALADLRTHDDDKAI